jgi:hypothetical protein
MASVVGQVDELLEIDPQDTRHLFWEEIKRIFFAMRELKEDDLDDEIMNEFLSAMDGISNVLHRIERRRRERQKARKNRPVNGDQLKSGSVFTRYLAFSRFSKS